MCTLGEWGRTANGGLMPLMELRSAAGLRGVVLHFARRPAPSNTFQDLGCWTLPLTMGWGQGMGEGCRTQWCQP